MSDVLVQALKEAMARPEEQPLFKSGKQPGLFAARTGAPGEAAQHAIRDGLLEVVRTETKGKSSIEFVRITPRGVQFVYQHESPKAVLEELVQVLQQNQEGMPRWVQEMRSQLQALTNRFNDLLERQSRWLETLQQRTEEALRRLGTEPKQPAAVSSWQLDVLDYLDQRRVAVNSAECTLPELFSHLRERHADLVLPVFHEGLANLRDRGSIELIPFTGHLSELAEPEFALLEGSAVYHTVRRR
jgi:hypothetical protein